MELTAGNVLTLCSVLIAIVSICYVTNRQLLKFRFGKCDFVFLGIMFFLIVYLVLFPLWKELGFYCKRLCFDTNRLPTAGTWAFILALIMLLWFLWKVVRGSFKEEKADEQINYYLSLIYDNPVFLYNTITSFHKKELDRYIEDTNSKINNSEADKDRAFNKERNGRVPFPAKLLQEVIFSEAFIDSTLDKSPLLFLKLTSKIQSKQFVGFEEAAKHYFKGLLKNGNSYLIDGIHLTENYEGEDNIAYRLTDSVFANLLFSNLDYTVNSGICAVFDQVAEKDLKDKSFYQKEYSTWPEDETLDRYGFLAIKFYDILIRHLIAYKLDDGKADLLKKYFVYPEYSIIPKILIRDYGATLDNHTNADELLRQCMSDIRDWIKCCVSKGNVAYGSHLAASVVHNVLPMQLYNGNHNTWASLVNLRQWLFRLLFDVETIEKKENKTPELSQAIEGLIFKEIKESPKQMKEAWKKVDKMSNQYSCSFQRLKDALD